LPAFTVKRDTAAGTWNRLLPSLIPMSQPCRPAWIARLGNGTATPRAPFSASTTMSYRHGCAEQAAAATRRRRQLQTWMHVHPGWMPAIELKGEAHADIANARERPVIYWIDNTVFAELVARAGLHQAGIRAHHYSDWVHEYGQSLLSRPSCNGESSSLSSGSWMNASSAIRTPTSGPCASLPP
jgi:hypothetical protein